MARKVVRLTEGEMQQIIRESIDRVLNELTIKQAAIGREYNIMATHDMQNSESNVTFGSQNKDTNDRLGKSQMIQYDLLNKALNDELGELKLDFAQVSNGGNTSQLIFFVKKILLLNEKQVIFEGQGIVNRQPSDKEIVVYDIVNKRFFWVNYYNRAKGTFRGIRDLTLPEGKKGTYLVNAHNKSKLFGFINNYVNVVNNRITQGDKLNITL